MTRRGIAVTGAIRWLWLSTCALSLVSCTLEPHQVSVQPELTVQRPAVVAERDLMLEVVDKRPRNVFGYRGGVDPMTAPVGPGSSVTVAVRSALARAFRSYGFIVHSHDASNLPRVRVEIERLDYVAERRSWPTLVRTLGTVKVIYQYGQEYYTNHFSAEYSEGVKWAPSATTNTRIINRTLSRVLQRLLTDPELLEHLSRAEDTRLSSRLMGDSEVPSKNKSSAPSSQ